MSQQMPAEQEIREQFLQFYEKYRRQDQRDFYKRNIEEFTSAQRQAVWCTVILSFLTTAMGIIGGFVPSPSKPIFLALAAIFPIISTALAGYSALHGFEQQTKLYQDARKNLTSISFPNLQQEQQNGDPTSEIRSFVNKVEDVLQKEHSFWGQLDIVPPGT